MSTTHEAKLLEAIRRKRPKWKNIPENTAAAIELQRLWKAMQGEFDEATFRATLNQLLENQTLVGCYLVHNRRTDREFERRLKAVPAIWPLLKTDFRYHSGRRETVIDVHVAIISDGLSKRMLRTLQARV